MEEKTLVIAATTPLFIVTGETRDGYADYFNAVYVSLQSAKAAIVKEIKEVYELETVEGEDNSISSVDGYVTYHIHEATLSL